MPHDKDPLTDMLAAAYRLRDHMKDMKRETFDADELYQLGIAKLVEHIGEAANRVSRDFQAEHPEIPWRNIIGMRNVLIHNYEQIDENEVWDAATISVPRLIAQLESLVSTEEEDET